MLRRMYELKELQQYRKHASLKLLEHMKNDFDKKSITRYFQWGDLVLKWDTRGEDMEKHGNFYNLWMGPYHISVEQDNNTFTFAQLNGEMLEGNFNGRLLKHFFMYWTSKKYPKRIVHNRIWVVKFHFIRGNLDEKGASSGKWLKNLCREFFYTISLLSNLPRVIWLW